MTKLGDFLKAEREKRSLSFHEIGMSLKINPKILKAIEDGDQANLPAKTFLRGFVKSYAQYLRLDVNQALQMFKEEYGKEAAPSVNEPSAPQVAASAPNVPKFENSLRRPDDAALPSGNNNRIYTILVTILLLTLIAFVAKMMDKYQKESRDAKPEVAEATTTTTTSTLQVAKETVPEAGAETSTESVITTSTVAASSMSSTTTLRPVSSTPVSSVITSPTTTTTTLRLPATTTTTLRPAAVNIPPTTTTTTTSSTTTTTTLKPAITEVIVEALNRVGIRFSLNGGQKWESLELNPDQVHTFRSRTSIQLEVTDGGAVNIILNGRDRGVPGTIGRPLKLNFP